jgi:PTH2 family peptidyl-tRNA hydrolase
MFKQAIIVRTDLDLGKGKIAAQVAHASVEAMLATQKAKPEWVSTWLAEGQKKVVLKVESGDALKMLFEEIRRQIPAKLVFDAGHTQVEPGTLTCLGVGPAPEPEIDRFVSNLKLL